MSQVWDYLRLSVGLALLGGACSAAPTGGADSRVGGSRGLPDPSSSNAAGSGGLIVGQPAATGGASGTLLPGPGNPGVRPPASGDACEVVQLVTDPVIPEMMIVLDRSGSMTEGGRWMPSVAAVRSVTEQLQSKIHFGLALFPDPDAAPSGIPTVTNLADCFTAPNPQMCIEQFGAANGDDVACAPGKIFVPVAQNSATMIASVLDKTSPFGGTPTSDTLTQILSTYGSTEPSPDMKPHPKFVLLVTDGQPTCPTGMGSNVNQADIDASNAAVEALAMNDVRTYVIGYDTAGPENSALAATLDGFAVRGGTGDMTHRTVEDEQSLVTELNRITFAIASCSFELNSPPDRADHVLVRLDGVQVNLDTPDGFAIVGERTVELRGRACDTYREGNHLLDAQVLCEVVQPQ